MTTREIKSRSDRALNYSRPTLYPPTTCVRVCLCARPEKNAQIVYLLVPSLGDSTRGGRDIARTGKTVYKWHVPGARWARINNETSEFEDCQSLFPGFGGGGGGGGGDARGEKRQMDNSTAVLGHVPISLGCASYLLSRVDISIPVWCFLFGARARIRRVSIRWVHLLKLVSIRAMY